MDDAATVLDAEERTDLPDFSAPADEGDSHPLNDAAAPATPVDAAPEDFRADDAEARPPFECIVEALLFATDTPLSARKLAELAGEGTGGQVEQAIERLNQKYASVDLSFRIERIAGGYQLLSTARFRRWLTQLDKSRAQNRLGDAALETLSIIAYRQPIIRADIEAIRGVACGEVLHRLREVGLVRIAGRAEVVGRPLLYATTKKFLDTFGLGGLEDLPAMEGTSFASRRRVAAEVDADGPADSADASASPPAATEEVTPDDDR